jgi:hypothetical protein
MSADAWQTSQNGYPTLDSGTTGPPPRLRKWIVPGTKRHLLLRDGSAGFLLVHLATWYHAKVEPLDHEVTWDDWGYAQRNVRGSTSLVSNHSSGTACDLNATQHPMGVATAKTFTPKQTADIRKRLTFYAGCIRWGGDYQNRPDAMHFEIDKGMGPVEKRARELLDSKRGKAILEANPGARAVILS